jgi:hypothetical protein
MELYRMIAQVTDSVLTFAGVLVICWTSLLLVAMIKK